jgi:hypothetical protein
MLKKARCYILLLSLDVLMPGVSNGQRSGGIDDSLTFAANIQEVGYRKTDFYLPAYNLGIFIWEGRAEFWLPPHNNFSWGPYAKFAGTVQSDTTAYPNGLLGAPGVGLQLYPFSFSPLRQPGSKIGAILGPIRLFAEYNRIKFLGAENVWRPTSQVRGGIEYWKAINVNTTFSPWWLEVWNGLSWQSSNEFTPSYNSLVFGNAWRSGIRKTGKGAIPSITPYLALQSSKTKYDKAGVQNCAFNSPTSGPNPCDFYWENGLLIGGGLRFAPRLPNGGNGWLNRFVIYGEYLDTVTYYGPSPPASVPRFDVRIGASASFGDWYKRQN